MAQILRSTTRGSRAADTRAWLLVAGATVAWFIAYNLIQPLAD